MTSTQRSDINAGKGKIHAEIVKVSWPSPDGVIYYAWDALLNDPTYVSPLTTFLAGRSLVPAFVADSRTAKFHELPMTLTLGDDVVTMRFSNEGREIERLINKHGSGVKVEFFDFYPMVDSGFAWKLWTGKLRTPTVHGSVTKAFVTLTAVSGFASSNMQVPNFAFSQQCPVRYPVGPGGAMSLSERLMHPCSYNRDLDGSPDQATLGGAKGLLNGDGNPFPTCAHTEADCINHFGHSRVFMGTKTVIDTVPVGAGEHKTYSTTHGRYGSLIEPISVVAGERDVTAVLVDWRNEVNPSPDHLDAGTKVTLFVPCIGPVEAVTDIQLMEATPQGIDLRLGTDEQTATVFSPSAPSLNRRVVINANKNPTNPAEIQVEQLKLTCHVKGSNDVRTYTDQTTFTTGYTNNRAWWVLRFLIDTWFGLRIDPAEVPMTDFIYLAGKNVSFNCQVTARSAQQQLADILESARWYPPFYFNGIWRWLPIEELDLGAGDIPTFTDAGANRNIVIARENDSVLSTVSPARQDPGEQANDIYLQFDDADHKNITRPLHFPDWTAQARAGRVYGDNTKTPIGKTYTAYGITSLAEAVPLGAFLRDLGRYWLPNECGLANNCEVQYVTRPSQFAEAMELHLGKAIFLDSENVDDAIYKDPNDNPFAAWIVKAMTRTTEGDLVVTVQAYGKSYYDGQCSPSSGYVQWTHNAGTIDGEFGTDTELLTVNGTLGSTGVTWDSPIISTDVVLDRVVHTVRALPAANSYNVWFIPQELGFKIWADGSAWIYTENGINNTSLPAASIVAGDTLSMEFDKNGGSPIRRYKHNGVTKATGTTSVVALHAIEATGFVTAGMQIGPVFWEVFPCSPSDEQDPGESGGITVTASTTTPLTALGIAGGEAFGAPRINLNIAPAGIVGVETFGTATVAGGTVIVAPSGIAGAETFGAATAANAVDADLTLWLAAWKETGFADNDPMATLTDFSSSGHNFTQATSGKRPLYKTGALNSQPGFYFDGTDDWVSCAAFMSGDAEAYFVLKCDDATGARGAYKFDGGTNANHITFFGTIYSSFGSASRFSYTPSSGSVVTSGFIHQIQAKVGTSNWIVYENGNNAKITQSPTQQWSGGSSPVHMIGGSSDQANGSSQTNFFKGYVLEVRIYNSPRTTAQRNAILAEFNSRYGISVTNF